MQGEREKALHPPACKVPPRPLSLPSDAGAAASRTALPRSPPPAPPLSLSLSLSLSGIPASSARADRGGGAPAMRGAGRAGGARGRGTRAGRAGAGPTAAAAAAGEVLCSGLLLLYTAVLAPVQVGPRIIYIIHMLYKYKYTGCCAAGGCCYTRRCRRRCRSARGAAPAAAQRLWRVRGRARGRHPHTHTHTHTHPPTRTRTRTRARARAPRARTHIHTSGTDLPVGLRRPAHRVILII